MKKKGLLVVLLALVLATAGVAYAYWESSLTMTAEVRTGNAAVNWYSVATNDDNGHENDGALAGHEHEADADNPAIGLGSRDPSGPANVPGDNHAPRVDAGVGTCSGLISNGVLTVYLENVYPGYTCTIWSAGRNGTGEAGQGTVPMAVEWIATTGTGVGLVDWTTQDGPSCNDILPAGGATETWVSTIHVGDSVGQNANLWLSRTITLRNFNQLSGTCVNP
jgi:hypothetical protein